MSSFETETIVALRPWSARAFVRDLANHGREYAGTFLTEFSVMASQMVAYKLAGLYLGREGFSEYALARRTASLIYPLTLLGLGVALPRYIGQANGLHHPGKAARYFAAGAWCVGLFAVAVMVLMNLLQRNVAYLFFGNKDYANLVFPLSLLTCGLALHAMAYSYFRGNLLMSQANCLQFINLGIIPLASFLFFRSSLRQVLTGLGLLTIAAAVAGLSLTPWKEIAQNTFPEARELLRYGLQRIPGDFAHLALLTLPATLAAHLSGVREAGNVAFGVSIVSIITALFTPVGLILLPKASRMLAEEAQTELRQHAYLLAKGGIVVSGALTVGLIVLANPLIRVYLGPGYADVALIVRILILGAVPYSLFLILRNVIDAAHENAVTGLILIAGFVVFCVGTGISSIFSRGTLPVLMPLLGGLATLGFLASRQTLKILRH